MTKKPDIIPPKDTKKKLPDNRINYLYLIGGIIALIIALRLLMNIALGLFMLFIGTTLISYWLSKKN